MYRPPNSTDIHFNKWEIRQALNNVFYEYFSTIPVEDRQTFIDKLIEWLDDLAEDIYD